MKNLYILTTALLMSTSFLSTFSQNQINAQKEFEQNLKNALIEDFVNIVTGNEVNEDHQNIKSFLPGGGISGTLFYNDGNSVDFVGVNNIGINRYGQSQNLDGKPVLWVDNNNSWVCIKLSEVSSIAYNNMEGNKLILSVNLISGETYDYSIAPSGNFMTVLIAAGNNAVEKRIQVFNSSELFINSIIFY